MGAFCVFGISKSQCLAKASKEVPEWEGSATGARFFTPAEWGRRRDARAADLFANQVKVEKISPEFDAPQFCLDWIATNPEEVRMTRIMVRGGKVDGLGDPVLRKGQQVFGWIEYAAEEVVHEA
jgi:hypothetical protein